MHSILVPYNTHLPHDCQYDYGIILVFPHPLIIPSQWVQFHNNLDTKISFIIRWDPAIGMDEHANNTVDHVVQLKSSLELDAISSKKSAFPIDYAGGNLGIGCQRLDLEVVESKCEKVCHYWLTNDFAMSVLTFCCSCGVKWSHFGFNLLFCLGVCNNSTAKIVLGLAQSVE